MIIINRKVVSCSVRCPKCDAKLVDGAERCPYCKTVLKADSASKSASGAANGSRLKMITLIVIKIEGTIEIGLIELIIPRERFVPARRRRMF